MPFSTNSLDSRLQRLEDELRDLKAMSSSFPQYDKTKHLEAIIANIKQTVNFCIDDTLLIYPESKHALLMLKTFLYQHLEHLK